VNAGGLHAASARWWSSAFHARGEVEPYGPARSPRAASSAVATTQWSSRCPSPRTCPRPADRKPLGHPRSPPGPCPSTRYAAWYSPLFEHRLQQRPVRSGAARPPRCRPAVRGQSYEIRFGRGEVCNRGRRVVAGGDHVSYPAGRGVGDRGRHRGPAPPMTAQSYPPLVKSFCTSTTMASLVTRSLQQDCPAGPLAATA